MTELTPLAEAASCSILLLFLGLPEAWRSSGVPAAAKRQLLGLARYPAHVALVLVGITLGIGAWMGSHATYWVHGLVELWSQERARAVMALSNKLSSYVIHRRFYQAQHAA
jgi:hypothetical protein